MTEDVHADDRPVPAEFEDEVRRMLERRASDVPASDGLAVLTPTAGRAPWHRRVGVLAAVAAVVVAVVAIGVAAWQTDDDQQLAVGGPPADGPTVLVPADGDTFVLEAIDVAPPEELAPEGFTAIEYGPADGGLTEGLAVIVGAGSEDPAPTGTPVTPDQNALLAELGAVMEGPAVVSWNDFVPNEDGTLSPVTVLWYGEGITTDQGLSIAAAVATDPRGELDGDPLPPGWATRSKSVLTESGVPTTAATMTGPWSAMLTSFPGRYPFTVWLVDWGEQGASVTGRQVDVRGGSGMLIGRTFTDDEGGSLRLDALVWQEDGMTHRLGLAMPTEGEIEVDLIGLADRLVAVDLDEALRRTGQDDELAATTMPASAPETATTIGGSTGTIDDDTNVETTGPPSVATTSMPVSMTAPGPGAIEGGPPTTGPNGETTTSGPVTTTPSGVQSTEGADGSIVTFTVPEPLLRPEGGFVANAIVPVVSSAIGEQAYELGVVWSPTFGFCMGFDFDGAITEGGFPVECEPEPAIGGGGSRVAPGDGVLIFAFANAAATSATFQLGGVVADAEVYWVPEFPEFSLLVFAFAGAPAESLEGADLPGAIALFDEDGQPIGWG